MPATAVTRRACLAVVLGLAWVAGQPVGRANNIRGFFTGTASQRTAQQQKPRLRISTNQPRWMGQVLQMRLTGEHGGRMGVFRRDRLFDEVDRGERGLLAWDAGHGAQDFDDPRSEFVVVEAFDHRPTAAGTHLLAIVSGPDFQPVHLYDVPRHKAATLGRMFRAMFETYNRPEFRHRDGSSIFGSWEASISMPGKISQPYLHVHGEQKVHFGRTPAIDPRRVTDWDAWARDNDYALVKEGGEGAYRVYAPKGRPVNGWTAIAVAHPSLGNPRTMSGRADGVVGSMVLDAAAHVLSGTDRSPGGHIEMARDDQQLVARVVSTSHRDRE